MLRIRNRLAMPADSRQEDKRDQRSDADVEVSTKMSVSPSSVQVQARSCTDHAQVIVKTGDHSDRAQTLSRKKKRRKIDVNPNNNDENDGNNDDSLNTNRHIFTAAKKLRKNKSNSEPVVQETKNVRRTKSKKLCNAAIEDSGRKRKKQKIDPDGSKLKANVVNLKRESDSPAEKIADTSDSIEMSSSFSASDLQRIEDSVADDYVSLNVKL